MRHGPGWLVAALLVVGVSSSAWSDATPPAPAATAESPTTPPRFGVQPSGAEPTEESAELLEPIGQPAAAQLEAEFDFSRAADYATLLAALQRIQAIVREGGERVESARAPRRLALDYIPESHRMRVQFDFVMAQHEYEHKAQGARVIARMIAAGQPVDDTLRFKLIERLLHDLEVIRYRNANINAYITAATQLLLILRDPRGLEVALTDETTMQHLRMEDGWSDDDAPAMFHELSKAYAAQDKEVWTVARVGLYELLTWRLGQGKGLTPHEPRFDLRTYMQLPSD